MSNDALAEINGIKPKVLLQDGEERDVSSMTSNSTYKVKRTIDHYYCTCPAWRNQSKFPISARTCKHLKSLLGDAYEEARLKSMNPSATLANSQVSKFQRGKRKRGSGEDGDDKNGSSNSNPEKKTRQFKPGSKGQGDGNKDDSNDSAEDNAAGGSKMTAKSVPDLLLACKWDLDTGIDPTGWWISEKLDGVRTYFDGKQFLSRLGNAFTPPNWFLNALPKDVTLDGELFGGRGNFQDTVSIVKTVNSPRWKDITFQIFDVPSLGSQPFEERLEYLKQAFGPGGTHTGSHVSVVEQTKARNKQHVLDKLKEVEGFGGEGVMLRKPESVYEGKRSNTLLKVKNFYDAEAIVTGYVPGKGRHSGSMGALKCKMASGKTFNVGTGLSDVQRAKPPKVGSIIVYRFQELTRDGVPRFPSFVGIAPDKTVPKDAEITTKDA